MIWATVSSQSCFCWLCRASPSSAAKNIINLILVLTSGCFLFVASSLVLLEEVRIHWRNIQNSYFLSDRDNHYGVVTHPEPDILRCEVKWALGSITVNKASGRNGIPAELFQILKDDAVKVLHSICQQIWNSAVATGLEKVSFHSNPKERECQKLFKLLHNCTHFAC